MSERKFNCNWCTHCTNKGRFGHPFKAQCSFNPEWVEIYNFNKHHCGQHEWDKEARAEIGKEIFR